LKYFSFLAMSDFFCIFVEKYTMTQVVLTLNERIADFVFKQADKQGVSTNELIEYYLESIFISENKIKKNTPKTKKWNSLDVALNSVRKGLPEDFKFNRDLANER